MISGNKSAALAQYSYAPGAYLSSQQPLRVTGHNSSHHQLQQQQKQGSKYSSSVGIISSSGPNATLTSLGSTPQVRTGSPHAKVTVSGTLLHSHIRNMSRNVCDKE